MMLSNKAGLFGPYNAKVPFVRPYVPRLITSSQESLGLIEDIWAKRRLLLLGTSLGLSLALGIGATMYIKHRRRSEGKDDV